MFRLLGLATFLTSSVLYAVTLPAGLSGPEIGRVVGILGSGSASRVVRSAESYPLYPGFKFGIEFSMFPTEEINFLGNGTGTLPSLNAVPRIYAAKGILPNLEISGNFFPATNGSFISTYGGILKYSFIREIETYLEGAIYSGYTHTSAYQGQFNADALEIGAMFSKDLVRLKPYAGMGMIFSIGYVSPGLALGPRIDGASANAHVFLGSEVELPLNLGFQLDLFNFSPGAVSLASSFFVGKKF